MVDGAKWIGDTGAGRLGSKFRPGDSGGPFFVWNAGLCSSGDRPGFAQNGEVTQAVVVAGVPVAVVSGPDVKGAWDTELDSYATATLNLRDWLTSTAGVSRLLLVDRGACDAGVATVGVRGTGNVIRSRFGNASNFELVAPRRLKDLLAQFWYL